MKAFICGCGHSGTTLLANMLAAHPDIYVPLRETRVFCSGDNESVLANWKKLEQEFLATGKSMLVEKTPSHINHIETIRAVVPGCRFVIPVRDGRDSIASFKRRWGGTSRTSRWINENGVVARQIYRSDALVFRYEDLIDQPQVVLRNITSFLDIEYVETLLEFHKTKRLWFGQNSVEKGSGRVGDEHRKLRNWEVNQPLYDNRGRWKDECSERELAPLKEGRGLFLMEMFGYVQASRMQISERSREQSGRNSRLKLVLKRTFARAH